MDLTLKPIGYVIGGREEAIDDAWGKVQARIELDAESYSPESLQGLEAFSHLLVVYFFHKVPQEKIETKARHPRNNAEWPAVGIFAQRGKNRPNRIGVSTCKILRVEGLCVEVEGLDAISGTPVLDIKPYMTGFEPLGEVKEPQWAQELMSKYWDAE